MLTRYCKNMEFLNVKKSVSYLSLIKKTNIMPIKKSDARRTKIKQIKNRDTHKTIVETCNENQTM
uniref:Uncharacterized protein n=1 Tax=Tetranychus urticae TaxID=32264 RepID=T1KHE3_TETUR